MKKILTTLAFAAITLCAAAQVKAPTEWGVRAGLSLMTYSGFESSSEYSYPLSPGFYVGAFAEWPQVYQDFGLRAEVNFATQGCKFRAKNEDYIFIMRSYNILVPVMAQYAFLDGRLKVMAGPQLGLCLGGKDIDKSSGITTTDKWDKDRPNTFDLSLVFGADYMIMEQLGVELRYDLGLTNVFSDKSVNYANRGLQLGLLYKF